MLYSTLLSYFVNEDASVDFRFFKSMDEDDIVFNCASKFHSKIFYFLDPKAKTFMYMHGYLGDILVARKYCHELRMNYEGNVNCIIVDWTTVAHDMNYIQVTNRLQKVSKNFTFSINLKGFF